MKPIREYEFDAVNGMFVPLCGLCAALGMTLAASISTGETMMFVMTAALAGTVVWYATHLRKRCRAFAARIRAVADKHDAAALETLRRQSEPLPSPQGLGPFARQIMQGRP